MLQKVERYTVIQQSNILLNFSNDQVFGVNDVTLIKQSDIGEHEVMDF